MQQQPQSLSKKPTLEDLMKDNNKIVEPKQIYNQSTYANQASSTSNNNNKLAL